MQTFHPVLEASSVCPVKKGQDKHELSGRLHLGCSTPELPGRIFRATAPDWPPLPCDAIEHTRRLCCRSWSG
jgi:hypothetical protein